jgi:hypothetical protein
MASDMTSVNRSITFVDPPNSNYFVTAKVPVNSLNADIMDIAFVRAVGQSHYPGGLEALMKDHRFGDAFSLGSHWAYKYLLDLDGMSYSGRFMAFMASDSAVVKSTIYQEYFSDWIQPWYVLVPYLFDLLFSMSIAGYTSYPYLHPTRKYTISMHSSLGRPHLHWKLPIRPCCKSLPEGADR